MAVKISAEEKRWRAESDASALKRAMEIQNDPSRMKEAKKVISEEYKAITKVAKSINATSSPKKGKK